jgi:hypothetical protein
MNRWIIVLLFCCLPLTSQAYSVTGTVEGGEGNGLKYVFAVPTSLDTFFFTIEIPFVNMYIFMNLDSGSYFFAAYQDVNSSVIPDLGEPYGFYGGTVPAPLLVDQNLEDINITLTTPEQGGFSGAITYGGTQTGNTLIVAYDNPDFTGTPRGAGFLMNNTGNGTYTAITDSQDTFYAFAFMDLNMNLQYEPEEPFGMYGGATPQAIEVELPDMPTGIDIRMADPESAIERPHIGSLPAGFSLGVPYPNPFNLETSIPFVLGYEADVQLLVYDLLGREVGLIDSGRMAAGEHTAKFNAHGYSSGIYFVELVADGSRSMQRVVLIK